MRRQPTSVAATNTLIVLVSDRPARLLPTIRSRCRILALPLPARDAALAWLREQGIGSPEAALAAAGGAPLAARDQARPEDAELQRRLLAELAKPSGADALTFAATIDRESVEPFIHWMQTWVHDLARVRLAAEPRHHGPLAQPLRARARNADLDLLFALDRQLAEARALAAHPLNARLLAEHLLMSYNRATSVP